MFDDLVLKDQEARANLKKLLCSQSEKSQFLEELDKSQSAFKVYQDLLKSREKIERLAANVNQELGKLAEAWKGKLLGAVLAEVPANTLLLDHRKRERDLVESIVLYQVMETELEKELQKAKEEMFKLNKISSDIKSRLDWQTRHEKAGYRISQDGALIR
jgi:hypothetical protein